MDTRRTQPVRGVEGIHCNVGRNDAASFKTLARDASCGDRVGEHREYHLINRRYLPPQDPRPGTLAIAARPEAEALFLSAQTCSSAFHDVQTHFSKH